MRSFFDKKFRAAVLAVVFSLSLVPVAAAGPKGRDREAPGIREEIARIVRVLKKAIGAPSTNADSLTIPRP
jgi:hypothetical protein